MTTTSFNFIEHTQQMNRARRRAKKWLISCSVAVLLLLLMGLFTHVFFPVNFKEINVALFCLIGLIALSMVSTVLLGSEQIKKNDTKIEDKLSALCSKLEREQKQYLLMYFNTYYSEIRKDVPKPEPKKTYNQALNEILDLFPELDNIIFELRGLHLDKTINLTHWRYNDSDAESSNLMEKVIFK
ncbi:hypothetical protein [Flagellimonas flava]|uniref:hypothetical protein n=1 Tax=Flagellimonas flava TaxID=570519 RepID=UPI003D654FF1